MAGSFLIDDLPALLNTDDFAVVGELFPADGSSNREITGIFDDEDVEIDDSIRGGMMMVKSARFMVQSCEQVAYRDRILIAKDQTQNGGDFRVAVIQDDGTGMTTLHLERIE